MWSKTGDAVMDAERYEAEQDKWLRKLPVCHKCKEHIQDDKCYKILDDIYCEECMEAKFRVWTEDLIEED